MPQIKKTDAVYINTDQSIKVSEDIFWKPVRTYFYYLISRVFRMPSTYIIALLGLAGCLIIVILPVFMDDSVKTFAVTMILTFLALFVIIFAGIFGISKSLNIFAEFETDGSELLVISKSISREQIITVKFLFLLIMGLVFSALITATIAIGFSIVGWDLYEAVDTAAVLSGSFIGALLSYCFMGILSIAIGLKVSGKLAKGLPSAILSFSSIIAMLGINLFSIITPNPPASFWTAITEVINTELKKTPVIVKDDKGQPVPVTEVYIGQSFISTDLKYFYTTASEHYFYYDTYFFKVQNTDVLRMFNLSEKETYLRDELKLTKFITDLTVAFLNNNPLGPTAALAVNFANPISAFATISGSTISADFSSITSGQIPYNYSFSEYALGDPIQRPSVRGGLIDIDYNIKVNKAMQWDQSWIIGLIWGGLFIALAIFTIAAYFRKDFK